MALLVVKQHGKEIMRLELESGKEYSAGRGSDCEISMQGSKGISRHHIKFYDRGGQWHAELISKYGALIVDSEPQTSVDLKPGTSFTVPPYEFIFEERTSAQPEEADFETEAEQSKALIIPNEEQDITANREMTSVGVSHLVPYLKVQYSDGRSETFRLEGHAWTAGREDTCEVLIQDPHASRKHFELAYTEEGYFVTDLGGANGTHLNGERLTPNVPTRMQSGDRLSIKTLTIDFEIRNSLFQNQLAVIENQIGPLVPVQSNFDAKSLMPSYEGPAVIKVGPEAQNWPPNYEGKAEPKRSRVGIIVIALCALFLFWLFSGPAPKKPEAEVTTTNSASLDPRVAFDKLTPEKKSAVRDTFNLARNLYMTGKYELCTAELKKLHESVPFYENSKELVNLCAQGSELAKVKADLEYKEEEKRRIEREIELVTDSCKEKVTKSPHISDSELQKCLAPAMELDPQHPKVVALMDEVKQRQSNREEQERMKAVEQQRNHQAQALYEKAKDLANKGRLRDAISEYEKLLTGSYSNPNDIKGKAAREVASVKSEFKVKVTRLLDACKELVDKNKFKDAYSACGDAIKEDPKSSSAASMQKKALSELRREMKAIYEDSVLEESLGNVDAAKEKWKKIMEENISSDDYFSKAKQKLEKYGIGI